MNITVTLFAQSLSFFLFVIFTMKYIWPPFAKVLDDRQKKIADGLAEAERAHRDLEVAEKKSLALVGEGKEKSRTLIEQAEKRRDAIIEEAKEEARIEGKRIVDAAKNDIEQERRLAKDALRAEVSTLALVAAERILMKEIDKNAHSDVLNKLTASL